MEPARMRPATSTAEQSRPSPEAMPSGRTRAAATASSTWMTTRTLSHPPIPSTPTARTGSRSTAKLDLSIEDATKILPMRHTDGPIWPSSSWPMNLLQIFSIKMVEIMGDLKWPLDVYGVVAVRDSLDHKRNILFCLRKGRLPDLNCFLFSVIYILYRFYSFDIRSAFSTLQT